MLRKRVAIILAESCMRDGLPDRMVSQTLVDSGTTKTT